MIETEEGLRAKISKRNLFKAIDDVRIAFEEEKVFVREAQVDGHGKRYRVFVGGFETKKEADGVAQKFVKDRLIRSYVVAKMPT